MKKVCSESDLVIEHVIELNVSDESEKDDEDSMQERKNLEIFRKKSDIVFRKNTEPNFNNFKAKNKNLKTIEFNQNIIPNFQDKKTQNKFLNNHKNDDKKPSPKTQNFHTKRDMGEIRSAINECIFEAQQYPNKNLSPTPTQKKTYNSH